MSYRPLPPSRTSGQNVPSDRPHRIVIETNSKRYTEITERIEKANKINKFSSAVGARIAKFSGKYHTKAAAHRAARRQAQDLDVQVIDQHGNQVKIAQYRIEDGALVLHVDLKGSIIQGFDTAAVSEQPVKIADRTRALARGLELAKERVGLMKALADA